MTVQISKIEASHLEKILNSEYFSAIQITKRPSKWIIELRKQGNKYIFSHPSLEQAIKDVSLFTAERERDDEFFGKRP